MEADVVEARGFVSSASTLLGPPARRGCKFLAADRGGADARVSRDPISLLRDGLRPGLLSTVAIEIAEELRHETESGVTWALTLALAMYAELANLSTEHGVPAVEVRQWLKEIEVRCLRVIQRATLWSEDAEGMRVASYIDGSDGDGASSASASVGDGIEAEDDVSWFFRQDDEPNGHAQPSPPQDATRQNGRDTVTFDDAVAHSHARFCGSLYEGLDSSRTVAAGRLCTVERLVCESLACVSHDGAGLRTSMHGHHVSTIAAQMDVVMFAGPHETRSCVFSGVLLPITDMTEQLRLAACLGCPTTHLTFDGAEEPAGSIPIATLALGGGLASNDVATWHAGASSLRPPSPSQRETAWAAFRRFCEDILRIRFGIRLVVIEGAIDSQTQGVLYGCGIATLSRVARQGLCRLAQASQGRILADVFAVQSEHAGRIEGSVLARVEASRRAPTVARHAVYLRAGCGRAFRDHHVIHSGSGALRRREGEGSGGFPAPMTAIVCAPIIASAKLLRSDFRKLLGKAILGARHGVLLGGGQLERNLIADLEEAREVQLRFYATCGAVSFHTAALVMERAIAAIRALGTAGGEAPAREVLPLQHAVYYDGAYERALGIRAAFRVNHLMLATDEVLTGDFFA